jgi:hypothetical protein
LLGQVSPKLHSSGRLDENVEGVSQRLGLVDHVTLVGLEADLSSKGPHGLDADVLGEGAELGVGGGGEVLEDGELVPDTVGGEVGHRRQGGLLVFRYHGADEFRLEFDDNSGGASVLLGWYGKGVDNQEVGGHGGHIGDVPSSGGS